MGLPGEFVFDGLVAVDDSGFGLTDTAFWVAGWRLVAGGGLLGGGWRLSGGGGGCGRLGSG